MESFFPMAWQPFTPRGVAQFAAAANTRLLLVQFFFALAAAAAVTWTIHAAWGGTLAQAVAALPERSEIRAGRLEWPDASPRLLAEGRCLSVSVDLEHSGALRGAAHVQVELGRASARILSLFGYWDLPYPKEFIFALNRTEAWPWWGAWSPVILATVFIGTLAGLLVIWAVLSWFYAAPVWLLAFLADRAMGFPGAWRLSGAAQMPGALLFTLGIGGYGLGIFDLVQGLVLGGAHFVLSWGYLITGTWAVTRVERGEGNNPFVADAADPASKTSPASKGNPFKSKE